MADTSNVRSTTAMSACISRPYEGTMLHELILTPMTSIVAVITLSISSFVYARYRCVWKTMIVITVILLAGAFIYWMSVKVLENWTLAVGSVVVVTGWQYAKNIGTFIGVITKWKTGITQLRRLLYSRQNMTGNRPGASAMDTDGGKVVMEHVYQSTRELSKDKIVTLTVKSEVRSEDVAALEDKSKAYEDVLSQMFVYLFQACGLREKLLEILTASTDGGKVAMERVYQLTRELSKDKIVTLTVKLEVRSEDVAALEDKSKAYKDVLSQMFFFLFLACGLREKLLEILPASCEGQVTEKQLENIARKFPHASYESFCNKLGVKVNWATNILVKHLGDRRPALMEILMAWRNKTGGPRTELTCYLVKAEVGDLAKILYS